MLGAVVADTITTLLAGGTLTIEADDGTTLSVHPVAAGLVVDDAVAVGTGTPATFTARTATGEVVATGPVSLPDIEEGADVVIEALTLED